jgi:hypothetical protein
MKITSYDILKTIAVILMIADHVGYYLYPEEIWLRIAGRLCVPMWFFLIGYARSRDLSAPIWIGCGLLIVANIPAGMSLIPINILGTIIFVRLILDGFMTRSLRDQSTFWGMNAVLLALIFPSALVTEYGTMGLILAIFGWMCRQEHELKDRYLIFAITSFSAYQFLIFGFGQVEFMALTAGLFCVFTALHFFRAGTFNAPPLIAPILRFTGHHTMAIYVAHLLTLKALGLYLYPERFIMWDWKMFSITGL